MGQVANERPSGPSRAIGERLRTWPPQAVAATTAVAGSILLTIVLVSIGFVITKSSLSPRIVGWDWSVQRWIALHRTTRLYTWADPGSIRWGTGAIPVVSG